MSLPTASAGPAGTWSTTTPGAHRHPPRHRASSRRVCTTTPLPRRPIACGQGGDVDVLPAGVDAAERGQRAGVLGDHRDPHADTSGVWVRPRGELLDRVDGVVEPGRRPGRGGRRRGSPWRGSGGRARPGRRAGRWARPRAATARPARRARTARRRACRRRPRGAPGRCCRRRRPRAPASSAASPARSVAPPRSVPPARRRPRGQRALGRAAGHQHPVARRRRGPATSRADQAARAAGPAPRRPGARRRTGPSPARADTSGSGRAHREPAVVAGRQRVAGGGGQRQHPLDLVQAGLRQPVPQVEQRARVVLAHGAHPRHAGQAQHAARWAAGSGGSW